MQRLTRAVRALAALGFALGCSSPTHEPAPSDSFAYLHDAAYRRTELERALVNPSNGYSTLRLAHYAVGGNADWDTLPEWNPAAESIARAELDAPGGAATSPLSSSASALTLPAVTSLDDPALIALGQAAFSHYPAQLGAYLAPALASAAQAASVGLWLDDARGVGGLVRARMADGSGAIALTCASCHSALGRSSIEDGLPNAALDLGAAILANGAPGGATEAANFAAWGPGRLDVTTTVGSEPARIPDLRPVRFLSYLQQDATLRQESIAALAIRIETLLITSSGQVSRPPRLIALALAVYVTSLAEALPSEQGAATSASTGAALFAGRCTSCHVPPALSGPPVALDVVGTDPTLGLSLNRGTGSYRVPSLHGVGTRGPLLHDGTAPSLAALFDPARTGANYAARLHGAGAIPGHAFGLDLSDTERAALLEYLQAL